jgi:NitT/TauT family transport system substrate-binding protein
MKKIARLLASAAVMVTVAGAAHAQKPEKPKLDLAVGGKVLLYYLPLTLADQLGYFKEQGLDVTITDFAGGAKSLQALIGGSADVVAGAFDHTIQMQAKNQPITAVVQLGRYPGIVLALSKGKVPNYKSPADLKGLKIGVTAPGSSTNFMVNFLLAKSHLKPEDVSFIGVGGGPSAVAAVKRGEIDAIANLDPVISQLESTGDIRIVADTRTTKGTEEVYGGPYPAAVMYTTPAFLKANPITTQALVNAFVQTLQWMQKATPEAIADKVPPEFLAGGRALYIEALKHSFGTYSPDGKFSMAGAENAYKVLSAFDTAVGGARIDLKQTFDESYVDKALAKSK